MSETVEIPESRIARWLLFSFASTFVIVAIWLFSQGDHQVVTGGAILLFVFLSTRLFNWAMSPGARVVLNEYGIEDRNNGFGLIEWRDITSAKIANVDETVFISLKVRNEEEYLARLTPLKRKTSQFGVRMGYSPINIAMFNLKITPEELLAMIQQRTRR